MGKIVSRIVAVSIPASVKTIESTAFYECAGFTTITIPDGVTLIEGSAFAYCRNLANGYGCKGVLTLSGKTVVVKKGAAKGTYTIKLKASVAKTNNYKGASTKTVTVKVRIR